jgi:hypothetical protein
MTLVGKGLILCLRIPHEAFECTARPFI